MINEESECKTVKTTAENSGIQEAEGDSASESSGGSSSAYNSEDSNDGKYSKDDLENLLPWILPKSGGGKIHMGDEETPSTWYKFCWTYAWFLVS